MPEAVNNPITAEQICDPDNIQVIIPVGDKKIQISLTRTQLKNPETQQRLPDLQELVFTLLEPRPLVSNQNFRRAVNPKTNLPYTQHKLSLHEWFNDPGDKVREKLQQSSIAGNYYQKIIDAMDSRLFPLAQEKGMITQKDLKQTLS